MPRKRPPTTHVKSERHAELGRRAIAGMPRDPRTGRLLKRPAPGEGPPGESAPAGGAQGGPAGGGQSGAPSPAPSDQPPDPPTARRRGWWTGPSR